MKCLLLTSLALISFTCCFAQGENLSPEQERLSFLKGKWTVDGNETTYIEICDWIQGNHMQCVATSSVSQTDNSTSYFTYSAIEGVYIYYGLYGGGTTRTLRGKWIEDRFVFEGQRQSAERLIKWRVTMKPDNGKIDIKEERSVDNGSWEERIRFQYKPVEE